MTRRARESFAVMDGTITTFGKQKLLSISRSVAVLLVVIFIGCLIATGFLVHQFSSCSSIATVQTSTLIVYDNPSIDSTTVSVTTPKVTIAPVVSTTQKAEKTDDIKDVRLPRSMRPHSYEIKLIPFIHEGNFTFHGQVTILINVTATSDNITLHADELIIDDVSVSEHLQTEQFHPIKRIALDDKFQFLVIYLDEPVQAGRQYLVNIKYKGELNNLLEGFYRSSYRENNETRWIAATQFQATDARKAFPCFDEPAYKATFEISLGRLKNMTSISNMPKSGNPEPIEGLPNYVWDHYQKSLPMSTYLVAFIVSDFESLSNKTFSIWTRKSALSQTKYGLRIGPEILKFYEEFFGIKFPLPKIDMIGLPDFSAGAMENWGLITYRESVLLYEENVSSKASLQRIAHVIAHELAHQWFGNLVTPVWWSDLWLNEGFATYVEYLGANVVNPHLKELDIFVINELHSALTLDALKSSHQISIQVNDPDEIGDIFDRISYSKGASVLRMMQNFLTMEVFQRGLNVYLSSLMYKNAEQDDLWHTLTVQSHKEKVLDPNVTIKEVMDTWTLQTGYPVVNVERNYEKGSISFHQERFSLDKINQSLVTWWIPLTFRFKNGPTKFIWMPKSTVVNEENYSVPRNSWLLVNINQTGYYRVNYDLSNWNLIISQLQEKNGHLVFDPKNRAQIIDDAMNLASAGYVDYEVALNITKYLRQETEYVPWKAAFTNFDYVYEMMIRTAHFDKLKAYLLNLMEELFTNVGFYENDSDSQLKVYLRTEMYYRSCRLGFRECIINAVQQFQTWRNSLNPDLKNEISKDLRQVVYCTAISVGGQEEWDFLWQRYLNAYVDNEREIFLLALGCSKEVWILSRYLEWAVTPNSNIRKHDAPRVFAAIANNPIGQELSYHFLKTEWGKIRTYLGPSSMALTSLIRSTTKNFNTWIDVNDFKEFLRERRSEFGIALRTAQQSIEQGEANINWMAKNFNKIVQWLESVKL